MVPCTCISLCVGRRPGRLDLPWVKGPIEAEINKIGCRVQAASLIDHLRPAMWGIAERSMTEQEQEQNDHC